MSPESLSPNLRKAIRIEQLRAARLLEPTLIATPETLQCQQVIDNLRTGLGQQEQACLASLQLRSEARGLVSRGLQKTDEWTRYLGRCTRHYRAVKAASLVDYEAVADFMLSIDTDFTMYDADLEPVVIPDNAEDAEIILLPDPAMETAARLIADAFTLPSEVT